MRHIVFKGFSAASLQVITSIGELVEMCSPQILSGWRPLFSALRTVHSSKSDTKDYLLGEYSMGTSDIYQHTVVKNLKFSLNLKKGKSVAVICAHKMFIPFSISSSSSLSFLHSLHLFPPLL